MSYGPFPYKQHRCSGQLEELCQISRTRTGSSIHNLCLSINLSTSISMPLCWLLSYQGRQQHPSVSLGFERRGRVGRLWRRAEGCTQMAASYTAGMCNLRHHLTCKKECVAEKNSMISCGIFCELSLCILWLERIVFAEPHSSHISHLDQRQSAKGWTLSLTKYADCMT